MEDLIKYLNMRIKALEAECVNKDSEIKFLSRKLNKIQKSNK
jgi:hypothetical protein